ncbi:MAG: (2Fe-2S)-binding protein [Polyangiaceae bacterium]|nr:(2Fe-2S)-binding protein [Polyangiaceae bacterium]
MIVCHCRAISDKTIRAHVRAGCDSRRSIASACGAGTDCGGCARTVSEVIVDESASAERRSLSLPLFVSA